ncbi:MAG: hypothetical protein Ct9H90mP5_04550 [Acidimicrobiaceae bacterium]|nr:MAG: hypothetical protein Ct9H90mP5_04550 [Acidimicrobiaceae bacterium]
MRISADPNGLWVMANKTLKAVDLATLPYPGIATDYKPFLFAMLAVSEGVGIVTENLFSGRFRYIDELIRMGADIPNRRPSCSDTRCRELIRGSCSRS